MNGATTIQERLKDLRLNKGLKLEELAEQTVVNPTAFQKCYHLITQMKLP